MRKRKKLGRPSHTTVAAYLSLFLVISGGAAFAASHLAKNSVGTKQLKKNSVTTAKIKKEAVTAAKVKKGTLTGTQINSSTLGTVPLAQTANSLSPPEGLHEPTLLNSWKNPPPTGLFSVFEPVAFYKDHDGVVHLSGVALFGEPKTPIFQLPPGYRPASGKRLALAVACSPCGGIDTGVLGIDGPNLAAGLDGAVQPPEATVVSLDGVTFRAES